MELPPSTEVSSSLEPALETTVGVNGVSASAAASAESESESSSSAAISPSGDASKGLTSPAAAP